jgi:hypothetical protein
MCPFCLLTGIAVASGSISAGGLGAFLIGKARAKHAMNSAGSELESRARGKSSYPPAGETTPPAACRELVTTDEAEF